MTTRSLPMPSDLVDAMNPMRKAALDGLAHLERSQNEDGWVPMQRESLAAIKQHVADLETALREAASALRAGAEPVAYRWVRNGVPMPYWVGGVPSERQFQAARNCKDIAEWAVEYAYAGPTPPASKGGE